MVKSEGMGQYERRLAEHERRIEQHKFASLVESLAESETIWCETAPLMTEAERAEIDQMRLRAHQKGAELLAEHGQPVPGNDPRRVN